MMTDLLVVKMSAPSRVVGWTSILGLLAFDAVILVANNGQFVGALIAVILSLPLIWVIYRVSIRPKLIVRTGSVSVVNVWSSSEFRRSDVVDATGGRTLRLELADGRKIAVWAVQNDGRAVVANRPGRADRVAMELNDSWLGRRV